MATARTITPARTGFWCAIIHAIAFPATTWNSSGFFSSLRSSFCANLAALLQDGVPARLPLWSQSSSKVLPCCSSRCSSPPRLSLARGGSRCAWRPRTCSRKVMRPFAATRRPRPPPRAGPSGGRPAKGPRRRRGWSHRLPAAGTWSDAAADDAFRGSRSDARFDADRPVPRALPGAPPSRRRGGVLAGDAARAGRRLAVCRTLRAGPGRPDPDAARRRRRHHLGTGHGSRAPPLLAAPPDRPRCQGVIMRAVRLHKIGEQFQVDQLPDPVAPPGGAVVRLEAAALNHRDEFIRVGLYAKIQLPAVLGSDGAGVVESVGPGVAASWVGRKVVVNPAD